MRTLRAMFKETILFAALSLKRCGRVRLIGMMAACLEHCPIRRYGSCVVRDSSNILVFTLSGRTSVAPSRF